MLRKAIVHIGPMKTGSTAIQHWLSHRADALDEDGVHVVRSLGRNMSRLSALTLARVYGETPIASDFERLVEMGTEVGALPDTTHTLVLSGETLSQQLSSPREVAVLKEMLDEFCDHYTIIAYLRRQDQLSVSRYSTVLRRGERNPRPLSRAIDYQAMLDCWAQVFGREAITPRIFERSSLIGGDVVRDFAAAAGFAFEPVPADVASQNSGLRPEAQQLLLDLSQRARTAGVEGPLAQFGRMDELNEVLNRHFSGNGVMPTRAEALAFYDTVRPSNEAVRAAWFRERESLFDEDFTAYPEARPPAPSAEQVLEVAMTVLAQLIPTRHERVAVDHDSKARSAVEQRMREQRRQRGPGKGGRRAGGGR